MFNNLGQLSVDLYNMQLKGHLTSFTIFWLAVVEHHSGWEEMIALVRLFERRCTCHGPSGSWQRAEGLCVLLSTSEWSSTTPIPQPRPLKGHYFAPYVCRVNLDFHTHTHTLTSRYQTPWLSGKIIYAPKWFQFPSFAVWKIVSAEATESLESIAAC